MTVVVIVLTVLWALVFIAATTWPRRRELDLWARQSELDFWDLPTEPLERNGTMRPAAFSGFSGFSGFGGFGGFGGCGGGGSGCGGGGGC